MTVLKSIRLGLVTIGTLALCGPALAETTSPGMNDAKSASGTQTPSTSDKAEPKKSDSKNRADSTRQSNNQKNSQSGSQAAGSQQANSPSKKEVRDAQRLLQRSHGYDGEIDGLLGPKTREALRAFQAANGLSATGTMTSATRKRLGGAAESYFDRQPISGAQASDQPRIENASGSNHYAVSELTEEQIRTFQRRLRGYGYYDGEIDGVMGQKTRSGMQRFLKRQVDLMSRGELHADIMDLFGVDPRDVQRVSGPNSGNRAQPVRQRQPGTQGTAHDAVEPTDAPTTAEEEQRKQRSTTPPEGYAR